MEKHLRTKWQIEIRWITMNRDGDAVSNPFFLMALKMAYGHNSRNTEQMTHDSHTCETQQTQLSSLLSKAGNNHRYSCSVMWQTSGVSYLLYWLATHSWNTRHSFNKEALFNVARWRPAAKLFMMRFKPYVWHKHFLICTSQSKVSVHTGIKKVVGIVNNKC